MPAFLHRERDNASLFAYLKRELGPRGDGIVDFVLDVQRRFSRIRDANLLAIIIDAEEDTTSAVIRVSRDGLQKAVGCQTLELDVLRLSQGRFLSAFRSHMNGIMNAKFFVRIIVHIRWAFKDGIDIGKR